MPSVTVTPLSGGSAVTLPQFNDISYGSQREVSFGWQTPLKDIYADIVGLAATNVQVERNRNGTYVAIADPGAQAVEVSWTEYELDTRVPLSKTAKGVITLSGTTYRNLAETTTMTLWRVQWLFIRATGESYELV